MELFSSFTLETFIATLHALSNGRPLPAPQDFPVERAYTKFIFNLEDKEDKDAFEVIIKAKYVTFRDGCNHYQPGATGLVKAAAGYYFIDLPTGVQTAMACPTNTWHREVVDIKLSENVFPYNSVTPIVIHAFNGAHVEYEIRAKTVSETTQSDQ